ncbi:MAG: type I DNA topoisomerase [Spirochaeta sp.]|jgi:DNA topoisomerase-1|nr:type I DNA topoisomerase [Spirochaeta sp.]
MAETALVIVESPTKARTIKRFLPKNFVVEASIGHVRDLPQSASEIPAKHKKEAWARIGIDVERDFAPLYVTPKGKAKVIRQLKQQLKEADVLYLATDEDREGESISWHLLEILKPKVPVRRLVFHEITKTAIQHALENYRSVDLKLVRAQETRRILDRLYGYTLSPLIWKKIAYGLSAGRVQSPGLRMIVDRERERVRFRAAEYWDLLARLEKPGTAPAFDARLTEYGGKRLAGGKDFDQLTGTLKHDGVIQLTAADAQKLQGDLNDGTWTVEDVTSRDVTNRPAPPFITSTLQQEGNRKLGLSARETMRTAQRLYEEGFITYMRTDSPTLSTEAVAGARSQIESLYGADFLSESPRQFSATGRDAQEAHEAIRPAGTEFRHPEETGLSGRERSLYELIWKRTVASQMADAKKRSMAVKIRVGDARFTANGNSIVFPGFLRVYVEGKDNPEAALEDKEVLLPPLESGDSLSVQSLDTEQHQTKPPARYTEASLVQRLEKEGIGRPSTYASIINTLYERNYIRRQDRSLVPTFTGMAVVELLEDHFEELITYSFTSNMETALDEIAVGERDSLHYLQDFYLGETGLQQRVEQRESEIKPEHSRSIALPQLSEHQAVKIGRYGAYIVHQADGEEIHASIPEEYAPADLTESDIHELIEIQKNGPEPIGTHPETGDNVYCLTGRYGPYLQLGETPEDESKPKRASLPKGVRPSEVSMELAVKLLSLPRTLGVHPEKGTEVVANIGRFGPFVVTDGEYRSLKKDDNVYTIDLDRALELLAQEKKGRRGSTVLKDFGQDPSGKRKVAIYDGRYGPYIKAGTKNISLPEELRTSEAIESLTLEQVREIIKSKE